MKYYFSTILCILFFLHGYSQTGIPITITGKVVAEDKTPLAGVSVHAFKNNRYNATDAGGKFILNGVVLPDTLIFSYVGYTAQLVPVTKMTPLPLSIRLLRSADVSMDSVTIYNTGYQAISRERATGSFTQVDNKTLNLQVGSNILNRLESVASSVAFNKKNNTAPSISVRGLSTINGPTSPLIILDNFPFEGDINSINPNMIESITILKDATAASIWGTRAGNGVIVINTKKGKFNQPFTIDFNTNVQVYAKPDIFYTHPISSSDYIDVEKYLYSQGYYDYTLTDPSHPVVSPVIELLDRAARGVITPADAESQIATLRKVDVRNEFNRYVYSNAVNQQYAVNLSGGNSQMAWSASGGMDKNLSSFGEKYQRLTARLENSFTPIRNLKITGSLYVTGTTTASGKESYTTQNYLYPYSRLKDAGGADLPAARDYPLSYTDSAGGGKLLNWNFYPLDNYKHTYANTVSNNLLANFGIQYLLGEGFSIDLKYQYEGQQSQTKAINDAQSYEARNLVNLFSEVDPNTGVVNYIVPKGGILNMANSGLKANNIREQVNYSHRWGKHQLVAIAGNETREIHTNGETYTSFGYNPETLSSSSIDLINSYPLYTNGYYYNIPAGANDFEDQLRRYVSFYGNAAYTYNNRYGITVSGRRDASNLFGVNTNQKWTPLWSAGMSWDISKEHFYKSKLLPFLKLRATYGYTGNADPNRSGVVTIYYGTNSYTTNFPQAYIRQFPNPNLRWEKVGIANVGVDFNSRGNRVSGSIDWYQKKGIDLFGAALIDITAGLGQNGLTKNVASMVGKGVDVVINTVNTKGKLIWSTGLIFNYNSDKVTHAYLSSKNAVRYLNDGNGITAIEGRTVHSILSYKWGGLEHNTGNPQGYLNGILSTDYGSITGSGTAISDLVYGGPALPQVFGSLTNSLSWKRLQMTVNISYKFHYFFKKQALIYSDLFGNDKKSSADYVRRWQKPGDELITDVPSMQYPADGNRDYFYANSSALVEKGDHIRLQFITISYTCPLQKASFFPGRNIQVYVNASNLGILWREIKKGLILTMQLRTYLFPKPTPWV